MKNTLGDIHRCYVRKGFHGEVWEMFGKNKGNLIKPLRAPSRALRASGVSTGDNTEDFSNFRDNTPFPWSFLKVSQETHFSIYTIFKNCPFPPKLRKRSILYLSSYHSCFSFSFYLIVFPLTFYFYVFKLLSRGWLSAFYLPLHIIYFYCIKKTD